MHGNGPNGITCTFDTYQGLYAIRNDRETDFVNLKVLKVLKITYVL